MSEAPNRVRAVATHPVQYMDPVSRRMANHPAFDLHVSCCDLRGAEAAHDSEFGTNINWDVPVLDGYTWAHVPNRSSGAESFFGFCNPGYWESFVVEISTLSYASPPTVGPL